VVTGQLRGSRRSLDRRTSETSEERSGTLTRRATSHIFVSPNLRIPTRTNWTFDVDYGPKEQESRIGSTLVLQP
jgi:hypothetical protein